MQNVIVDIGRVTGAQGKLTHDSDGQLEITLAEGKYCARTLSNEGSLTYHLDGLSITKEIHAVTPGGLIQNQTQMVTAKFTLRNR